MKRYPVGTKLKPNYNNGCTYEIRKQRGTWGFYVLSGNQKGEFHDWPNEDMFFSQVSAGFTVVRLGKATPKQQIKDLADELAAKDDEIAKINEKCERRVSEIGEFRNADLRRHGEFSAQLAKDRNEQCARADIAEKRAALLSESVTALKNALKSASESLCHSANAVKA